MIKSLNQTRKEVFSLSQTNIIKFFLGFQDPNITFPEVGAFEEIERKGRIIKIFKGFLRKNYSNCPHCNSKNIVKNGFRKRKIRFIPNQKYDTHLHLDVQRYYCKDCKHSFSPSTSIAEDNSSFSNNLIFSVAEDLKGNSSFTDIAKVNNISISSVIRIMNKKFNDYVPSKKFLPEVLCIDEFKSVKNIDGAMSFIFVDQEKRKIIDILEDRKLSSLTNYFSRFDSSARENVKYICMDMFTPYFSFTKAMFPNAGIILDKFHVVNLLSRALNKIRIDVMKSLKNKSTKKKLKTFWKLFLQYEVSTKVHYCRSFRRYLSNQDKINELLKCSTLLEENYNIYQYLLLAIKLGNFNMFENTINKYLKNSSGVSEKMLVALKSLKKYMKYIENMFRKPKITNGLIEGINNKIKVTKRTSYGYNTFKNLKKRVLIKAGVITMTA